MENISEQPKPKRWKRITIAVIVVFLLVGGAVLLKTGSVLNKISTEGGLFKSIVQSIPGVESKLDGEDEGRINVVLLGMRGENIPGGGLLADTIMVVSIKPDEKKASIISIPRDFYVHNPGWNGQSKINAVYAAGEENGKRQGLSDMKKVLSDISGVPIHYAASINFLGFTELVDILGGVDIHLDESFNEPLQFNEPHVCDPNVFTVPTGEYEIKRNEKGKIVAQYPLCTNPDTECGGNFSLPAGDITLDGETALCYVRSRVTTSDFDRARRQQEVLKQIKVKATSIGTLADFGKINAILDSVGDNVRTDMEAWEMKRFFDLYGELGDMEVDQKVLENSEEGLLYVPTDSDPSAGYILLPRGDSYDRIRDLFQTII